MRVERGRNRRRSDRRVSDSVEEDAKRRRVALISSVTFGRGLQLRTVPEDPGR
jgi:hypothetical protein